TRSRIARGFAWGVFFALAACGHTSTITAFDANALHAEGLGRYSTELFSSEHGPTNQRGAAAQPKVTPNFRGPVSTNDWWSSLAWSYDGNAFSKPMFPHPLAAQADASGLAIGYPSEAVVAPRGYRFPFVSDLRISVSDLHAPDARVESYSDWAVTAAW